MQDNTPWPPSDLVPDVLGVLDLARHDELYVVTGTVTTTAWTTGSREPAWPLTDQ